MNKNTKKALILTAVAAAGVGFWYFFLGPGAVPSSGSALPGTTAEPTGTNITGITVSGGVATPTFEGPNTYMQWSIGNYVSPMLPSIQAVKLPSDLAPGTYTLSMSPYVAASDGSWQPAGSLYGGANSIQVIV